MLMVFHFYADADVSSNQFTSDMTKKLTYEFNLFLTNILKLL